jgi:hypothetical protein
LVDGEERLALGVVPNTYEGVIRELEALQDPPHERLAVVWQYPEVVACLVAHPFWQGELDVPRRAFRRMRAGLSLQLAVRQDLHRSRVVLGDERTLLGRLRDQLHLVAVARNDAIRNLYGGAKRTR